MKSARRSAFKPDNCRKSPGPSPSCRINVGDEQIEGLPSKSLDGVGDPGGDHHAVADAAEDLLDERAHRQFVLDRTTFTIYLPRLGLRRAYR